MTREEIIKRVRDSPNKNFLLVLPTGMGKTRVALEILRQRVFLEFPVLIVVPRLVLIDNWKEELRKFHLEHYLPYITFTTYNSLHKHTETKWFYVVYDECHHISDRCKEILPNINSIYNSFLSATIKQDLKDWLLFNYKDIKLVEVNLREAIEHEVLPDPKIILIPMLLNYTNLTETIVKESKNKKHWITCQYKDRWKYLKNYNCRIQCTPAQYNLEMSNDIEYWKRRAMQNSIFKNKWLRLCGERLKWLSNQKNDIVLTLLKELKNYKTLTFCNSIEQTEILGKYCINSKNKESDEYLKMFNEGKIKHITACDMVNEGVNLTNCKIGIFASINNSDILTRQKSGRILRHKEPVIIIPYFKNTREVELVDKMLENYNKDLITIVENIKDIQL